MKSCGKKKTSFMFFVKLGEELQQKENLLCVLVFVELVRSYDRKITFFVFSFLRSGGKEKAFYVFIFIELVKSYGRKKMSFVFCSLRSLVKNSGKEKTSCVFCQN